MIRRVLTALFLLALFAFAPLVALSTQSWVDIRCARNLASFVCQVDERTVFSSSSRVFEVRQARSSMITIRTRRGGTIHKHQLVFDTPFGPVDVLEEESDSAEDVIAILSGINSAIATGAPGFAGTLAPGFGLWVSIALVALFGGLGLFLAFRVIVPKRPKDPAPPPPAPPAAPWSGASR